MIVGDNAPTRGWLLEGRRVRPQGTDWQMVGAFITFDAAMEWYEWRIRPHLNEPNSLWEFGFTEIDMLEVASAGA